MNWICFQNFCLLISRKKNYIKLYTLLDGTWARHLLEWICTNVLMCISFRIFNVLWPTSCVFRDAVGCQTNSYSKYQNGSFHQLISVSHQMWIHSLTMTELDSKSEISLEGHTILSKIGKLTTTHSPRVREYTNFPV